MNSKVKDLSIEEKIGQMIIIGMDSNKITNRIENMIKNFKIGGIILYRKNFKDYSDLLKLVRDLKKLNENNKIPLFIAIDQEGGRVNRMPKEILNLPAANKIAKTKDIKLVEESADITGKMLYESGFNLNFAPVLDVKRFDDNHVLGDRCFGDNVKDIEKYGIATMKKLQHNNILSVIKHFPGHGATKMDSHIALPIITKSMKKLEKEDMKVFEKAIKEGADAILVGHLLIRGVTNFLPSSLSRKFIYTYLRKKYRYNGLVVTDDLKMRAIKFIYGPMLAIRKAFEAGNDLVVFRFSKDEEEKAISHIIKLVEKGKIKEARINRSVNRIIKIKEKYNISDKQKFDGININEFNNRIEKIRKIAL